MAAALLALWGLSALARTPSAVSDRSDQPPEPIPTTTSPPSALDDHWVRLALPGSGELREIAQAADGSMVAVGGPRWGTGSVVWFSADGTVWEPVPDPGGGIDRAIVASITAGRSGFVAVGSVPLEPFDPGHGTAPAVPAAWTSADGHSWSRVADVEIERSGEVADRRGGMHRVVAGPWGLVALGWETSGSSQFAPAPRMEGRRYPGRIWLSRDGTSWRLAELKASYWVADVAVTARGLVAVGAWSGGRKMIWTSRNGEVWTPVPEQPVREGRGMEMVGVATTVSGTVVALAAPTTSLDGSSLVIGQRELWSSDDLLTWEPIKPTGLANSRMTRLVRLGDEVVGLAELDVFEGRGMAMWVTRDGRSWEAGGWSRLDAIISLDSALPRLLGGLHSTALGGPVLVGGHRDQPSVWMVAARPIEPTVSLPPPPDGGGHWVEVGALGPTAGSWIELHGTPRGVFGFGERGGLWSEDGRTWHRVENELGAPFRASWVSAVVATPSGLVAAGADVAGHARVWTSPDGRRWTAGADFGDGSLFELAVIGERVLAFGTRGGPQPASGETFLFLAESPSWDIVGERPNEATTLFPTTQPIVGRGDELLGWSWFDEPRLLSSRNGLDWVEVTAPPGDIGGLYASGSGPMVVSLDGSELYRYRDGSRWDEIPLPAGLTWPAVVDTEDATVVYSPFASGSGLLVGDAPGVWSEVPVDLAHGFTGTSLQVVPGVEGLVVVSYDRDSLRVWEWREAAGRP